MSDEAREALVAIKRMIRAAKGGCKEREKTTKVKS